MHPEDNGEAVEGFGGGEGEMSSPLALSFPFVLKSSVYIHDLAPL